ncbi:hypothetical protein LEP1GSC051_0334 [Leptospira sp. P2653]|nr:hypothetical protein LEP1GSC051_0334 [Leptospira sp. P2653]EMN43455.1 hypothetical protein LEP1GSC086_2878 [Leptospira weilii str. LNT 1234]
MTRELQDAHIFSRIRFLGMELKHHPHPEPLHVSRIPP